MTSRPISPPRATEAVFAKERSFDDAQAILCSLSRLRRTASSEPASSQGNLGTTKLLLEALGLQSSLTSMSFVHVAGTKGKGTTAAYTAALLQQAHGFRVGLFTSPHLTDVRERIVVQGGMLSEVVFARYFFELYDRLEALRYGNSDLLRRAARSAHFFVVMFLLSLHVFACEKMQVGVMEVGIGGRLDATNVIDPQVAVITSIGYDHTDLLGNSIAAIAAEKAGIVKPHAICFAATQTDHPEAREVIAAQARRQEARLAFVDDGIFPVRSWPRLAMGGWHVVENSKLALCAARTVAAMAAHGNSGSSLMVSPLTTNERAVLQTMTLAGRSQVWPGVMYVRHGRAAPYRVCRAAAETERNGEEGRSGEDNGTRNGSGCDRTIRFGDEATRENGNSDCSWAIATDDKADIKRTVYRNNTDSSNSSSSSKYDNKSNHACMDTSHEDRHTTSHGAIPVRVYLDGAHTVESITHMLEWFMTATASAGAVRRVLVFYTSRAAEPMVRAFAPVVRTLDKIILVPIRVMAGTTAVDTDAVAKGQVAAAMPASSAHLVTGARDAAAESAQVEALMECWLRVFGDTHVACLRREKPFGSMAELLHAAVGRESGCAVDGAHDTATTPVHVLVCGSFYLVGEVLTLLRAYDETNEQR